MIKDKIQDILNNQSNYYTIYRKRKANGKFRTIVAPNDEYKSIQKLIYDYLSEYHSLPIHSTAYAWIEGKSPELCALKHLHKKQIVEFDISDYFPSISDYHLLDLLDEVPIYGLLETLGITQAQLVYLLTISNKENTGRYLPQGFVTSPYLANAIRYPIDLILHSYAIDNSLTYTSYGDNLFFSGEKLPNKIGTYVKDILQVYAFNLNFKKVKYMPSHYKQKILGIVINDNINIDNVYKKEVMNEILTSQPSPSLIGKIKRFNLVSNKRDYNYLKTLYLKKHGIEIQ